MQEKFVYLKNCMRGYRKLTGKGRGIAGVQVGIPERFCVLYLSEEKDTTKKGRILNRVIQHEIDHLDGIVNIDKVPSDSLEFVSDPSFYKTASFTLVSK